MNTSNSLATQMKHRDREMVPRVLVVAMFALMGASLALVAYARLTDRPVSSVVAHSDIAKEITVTLKGNRSDGVAVLDAAGVQLAHSNETRKGFIDVVWAAVMRQRTVQNVPLEAPLRVVQRENGRVAILDDSTGFALELIGYGQDNVAAFARLLD